jgi:Glycosyl-transferase for dystroglycan
MGAPRSHNKRKRLALCPQRSIMAGVCLMTTLVVVALLVTTISLPNQDSVVFLVSDQVPTIWMEESKNSVSVQHILLPKKAGQQTSSFNDWTKDSNNHNLRLQSRSNSINVVYEQDVAVDYSTHTEFQGTYFDQSPACTPLDSVEQVSFTLVTQASMDRLWIMQHHCERWPAPHPISIAVYLPPEESPPPTEEFVMNELDRRWNCDASRMTVTVVKGFSPMDRYPINLLRNVAIRRVATSHFVYTDSDFLISDGLFHELLAVAPILASDPWAALVLPAFVYVSHCPQSVSTNNTESIECLRREGLPRSKEDLLPLWNASRHNLPKVKEGFHGKHFHGSTMYDEFKTQTEPLLLPCIENYLYEPYLAVRLCKDLPEFPEVFRGYGFNKNVWIMWLTRKLPYKLWQSPRGFVFHIPHPVSESWRRAQKADPVRGHLQKEAPKEHDAYLKWFKGVPLHPNRIPTCPKPKTGA